MVLLVTGGRDFRDFKAFNYAMRELPTPPTLVIQGGAKGADNLAKLWCAQNAVHCAEVKALWDHFQRAAGSKRNNIMLLLQPEYCLAMPGGNGTADMKRRAQAAGIPVWAPYG